MKKFLRAIAGLLLVMSIHTSVYGAPRYNNAQALRNIQKRVDNRDQRSLGSRRNIVSRLVTPSASLPASLNAFGGADRFFLAGADPSAGEKTVAIASLIQNPDGSRTVTITGIAPDAGVIVNGSGVEHGPLKGVQIDMLGLDGTDKKALVSITVPAAPVLFRRDQTRVPTSGQQVFLLLNDQGTELLTNNDNVLDAAGGVVNKPVLALAASGSKTCNRIVAAVPERDKNWDGKDPAAAGPATDVRGLAVLEINRPASAQELKVIPQTSILGALPISGIPGSDVIPFPGRIGAAGDGVMSFFALKDYPDGLDPNVRAVLGNAVDMYWDKTLERLFIGLSNVTRGNEKGANNTTTDDASKNYSLGVSSVLVGKFIVPPPERALCVDGDGAIFLQVSPVIKNISSYMLPDALTSDKGATIDATGYASKYILGFYRTADENASSDKLLATARKVRTMHTSTGKTYLIINGGVTHNIKNDANGNPIPADLNAQMYAIPLVDKGTDDEATGFVARSDGDVSGPFLEKTIDLQPLILAPEMQDVDGVVTSNNVYNLYNTTDSSVTVDSASDISDITNQASFRKFIKTAMPLSSNPAQRIGGTEDTNTFNQLLSFNGSADIRDVHVVGDTVYVGVASERDTNHNGESGIFASTALFAPTGEIVAWTPWQRVMGNHDAAYSIGFDGESSNFQYYSSDSGVGGGTNKASIVNVTQWGLGDTKRHNPTLPNAIKTSFPRGVNAIFSFGPDTSGFIPRNPGDQKNPKNRHEQLGMMVAVGDEQIAMVETGSLERPGKGVFEPTANFQTLVPDGDPVVNTQSTVFIFNESTVDDQGVALGNVGNLFAAELSRFPVSTVSGNNDRKGWLFVGGDQGVAVLTQNDDGHGWSTGEGEGLYELLSGISNHDFPGGRNWFFVQLMQKIPATATTPESSINVFNDVRKLVSDGNKYLYILTGRELFRIEMNNENFTTDVNTISTTGNGGFEARMNADKIVKIATMTDSISSESLRPLGDRGDQFFDVMVIQRNPNEDGPTSKILVATSRGVFLSGAISDGATMPSDLSAWTPLKTAGGANLGPSILLEFFSSQRGDHLVQNGNLHITAFDSAIGYLAKYRFYVTNGTVTPFKEPYITDAPAANTDYFFKIGTMVDRGNRQSNQLPAPDSFVARTATVPSSANGFAERVPVRPTPESFLKNVDTTTFKEIDLGLDVRLPLNSARLKINEASGTMLASGQFGVRVNE